MRFNFNQNAEQENIFINGLKKVTKIVCPHVRLNANPEDCGIIEFMKENTLHVTYPPSALGVVEIHGLKFNSSQKWEGQVTLEGSNLMHRRKFTLYGDILYIGKMVKLEEEEQ